MTFKVIMRQQSDNSTTMWRQIRLFGEGLVKEAEHEYEIRKTRCPKDGFT